MIYYNIYQINLFSRKCKCTTVFLKKRLKSINLMFLIIEIWWNHSNEIQKIFGKQNLVKIKLLIKINRALKCIFC